MHEKSPHNGGFFHGYEAQLTQSHPGHWDACYSSGAIGAKPKVVKTL